MNFKSLSLAALLATLIPLQEAAAEEVTLACDIREVVSFQNRVHIQCNLQGQGLLYYFAVPTSAAAEAQRLLTMGNAALLAGSTRTFWVSFDPYNYQAASYGCENVNCRRPTAFYFRK